MGRGDVSRFVPRHLTRAEIASVFQKKLRAVESQRLEAEISALIEPYGGMFAIDAEETQRVLDALVEYQDELIGEALREDEDEP